MNNDEEGNESVQYYRVDSGIEGVLDGVVRRMVSPDGPARYEVIDPYTDAWFEFEGASRVDRPDALDVSLVSEEEGLALARACSKKL